MHVSIVADDDSRYLVQLHHTDTEIRSPDRFTTAAAAHTAWQTLLSDNNLQQLLSNTGGHWRFLLRSNHSRLTLVSDTYHTRSAATAAADVLRTQLADTSPLPTSSCANRPTKCC